MPNEEFYSSATIARPTAEPKETNPEEPPAQVAASKEASNETQGKFIKGTFIKFSTGS